MKRILSKIDEDGSQEQKIEPIKSGEHSRHSFKSIKNLILKEPSFSHKSSNTGTQINKSEILSPKKLRIKRAQDRKNLTWFKKAMSLLIYKST